MKKNINIVFFGNYNKIVWNEEVNEKLFLILNELKMEIGQTYGHEIEIKENGLQNMKQVIKPYFSNVSNKITLNFTDNRMDFKIEVDSDEINGAIGNYYSYLRKISEEFKLEIDRIGVSYSEEVNINNELLKKHYLTIYDADEVVDFGIKQNKIKEIEISAGEVMKLNIFTMVEKNDQNCFVLLDINTVPNEKIMNEKSKELFLKEVLCLMDPLLKNIKSKLVGG